MVIDRSFGRACLAPCAGGIEEQLSPHMQKSDREIGDAAICDEYNVKCYTCTHRPTRFRALAGPEILNLVKELIQQVA